MFDDDMDEHERREAFYGLIDNAILDATEDLEEDEPPSEEALRLHAWVHRMLDDMKGLTAEQRPLIDWRSKSRGRA